MINVILVALSLWVPRPVMADPGFGPSSDPLSIAVRHDVDDSRYLELGKEFPSVVRIGRAAGTGTLIHPEWIITAGHVAAGMAGQFGTDFLIHVDGLDQPVRPAQVIIHPGFQEMGPMDLALIRLSRPVSHITPSQLLETPEEAGMPLILVGFGDTKAGSGGSWNQDGQRRGATNEIDAITDDHIVFDFDAPGKGATPLEGVSGPGDSGGPAFIEVEGTRYLAGVSSLGQSGSNGPGTYGAVERYVRIASHRAWIDRTMSNPPEEALVNVPAARASQGGPGGPGNAQAPGPLPDGVVMLESIGMMIADRNGAIQMVGRVDQLYPREFLDNGIRPPAKLISINGTPITSPGHAKSILEGINVGAQVEFRIEMSGRNRIITLKKP